MDTIPILSLIQKNLQEKQHLELTLQKEQLEDTLTPQTIAGDKMQSMRDKSHWDGLVDGIRARSAHKSDDEEDDKDEDDGDDDVPDR